MLSNEFKYIIKNETDEQINERISRYKYESLADEKILKALSGLIVCDKEIYDYVASKYKESREKLIFCKRVLCARRAKEVRELDVSL
jgi:hypothetical protein